MKQTTQKKPRTFRTLIRRIYISRKAKREESNAPAIRRKDEKKGNCLPFFFGP